MKLVPVFIFLSFTTFSYAQNGPSFTLSPDSILSAASRKLNDLKTLKYENKRELNYPSNNYLHKSAWAGYYDFEASHPLIHFKYQVEDSTSKFVFNGTEYFYLNKQNKTIEINDHPNKADVSDIHFLYNSLITLKNVLPLLINDKTVARSVSDTTIDGAHYFLVALNIGKRRIQNLGKGFDTMKTSYNFIYKIAIQKNSYLPYEVLQINDANTDFIKTTFTNFETTPTIPTEASWYYSAYTNEYKKNTNKAIPTLIPAGSVAPGWELELYNEKGKTISLSDLKGQVILLDFWIKNCGACIQSMPHLNELYNKFKDQNLKVISINSYDSRDDVRWFCNQHKANYPVLLNGRTVAENYGVNSFPTFLIIDKTGKIVTTKEGYNQTVKEELERAIQNAL